MCLQKGLIQINDGLVGGRKPLSIALHWFQVLELDLNATICYFLYEKFYRHNIGCLNVVPHTVLLRLL